MTHFLQSGSWEVQDQNPCLVSGQDCFQVHRWLSLLSSCDWSGREALWDCCLLLFLWLGDWAQGFAHSRLLLLLLLSCTSDPWIFFPKILIAFMGSALTTESPRCTLIFSSLSSPPCPWGVSCSLRRTGFETKAGFLSLPPQCRGHRHAPLHLVSPDS